MKCFNNCTVYYFSPAQMQTELYFIPFLVCTPVQMGTLDLNHAGELNGKQDQYQDSDPDQNFAAASYLDLCCI